MKVAASNWQEFTPDELSKGIHAGKIDLISLGMEASLGIIKLIQSGIDNGARGRRIRELQESDARTAQVLELYHNEIVALRNKITELESKLP